jgi:hypothetical protein
MSYTFLNARGQVVKDEPAALSVATEADDIEQAISLDAALRSSQVRIVGQYKLDHGGAT